MRKCEECKGKGQIVKLAGYDLNNPFWGNDAQGYEATCPDCRGYGRIIPQRAYMGQLHIGSGWVIPTSFHKIVRPIHA